MSTILEVAIGLFFVFLLFSLLVSAINEAVFGHLSHLRSRVLEDSLHTILSKQAKGFSIWAWFTKLPGSLVSWFKQSGDEARPGVFSDELLRHPLVRGLVVGSQRCPSYLPAETFVDATLGTLMKLGTAQAGPPSSPVLDKVTLSDLAVAVNQLADEHARKVLSSVLAGAKDLEEARIRLEAWFNNSMQRVSGVYRRYSQFWLYVWAALIVIWLNVDTIEITRRLLIDAQFRNTLAAGAANFVARPGISNIVAQAGSSLQPNAGGATSKATTTTAQSDSTAKTISPAQLMQQISQLNLPIGWGACGNDMPGNSVIGWIMIKLPRLEQSATTTNSDSFSMATGVLAPSAPCPATSEAWRLKLLGLLITIAAISQGAPFWFDLLNRVTNLRAAGRPPQPNPTAN